MRGESNEHGVKPEKMSLMRRNNESLKNRYRGAFLRRKIHIQPSKIEESF